MARVYQTNSVSLVARNVMLCSAHTVAPITESIKSRLARQLRIVSRNQQIDLYTLFSKSSQSKKMCGTLFEAIGLRIVPEGLDITLLPMVRLPQNPNARSHPRWYTSHCHWATSSFILNSLHFLGSARRNGVCFATTQTLHD